MAVLSTRVALQGHETLPRPRGGGVAGIDHDDEHEAFAASRSSDYVYQAGNDAAFDALDGHAETIEGESKLPLVVTGGTGCGKSALLANWVNSRRKVKHRDEFLFQHFVGCSPRSTQLTHLLHRLESALKDHFQLREMEVPTSEERLRWSLNRFLAAAAKKQFPARIVIVLDAVNRLRGESSAADTLHWLPTDLPQGVRIIVSTVELEQSGSLHNNLDEGSRLHRTYTELRRRKCPTIRLQPLSIEVRHLIIGSFLQLNQQALQSLEQAQQFRIVTAKASSQPLFLRTILHALRLGFELSDTSIDQQIDTCLAAETPSELISRVLDTCSGYVDSTANKNPGDRTVIRFFSRVLTALFTSRHGLSDTEMWGIVELATGEPLLSEQRECIRRILRDFTFSVNGLRSFSHVDYSTVVSNEYISAPEVHVRAHHLMARFFGKLPPCARKLDALPYHLEVSGTWPRLRAALVNVQMFHLWWTSAHKTEFLNLWASLTARANPGAPIRKLVTGEFNETMRCAQPPRPCLDLVEEYVRSVDEYKFSYSPSDDGLATVILRIADFMLEFATSSLEEAADVPQFIHPPIPNDDLASLGVPFLSKDKDGNSVLNSPLIGMTGTISSNPGGVDVAMKINEEVPICSTYFYHRWMWIQFPWVSLANCGERFLKGVIQRSEQEPLGGEVASRGGKIQRPTAATDVVVDGPKLPEIQASCTNPPLQRTARSDTKQSSHQKEKRSFVDHFASKLQQLRETIETYRHELDQMRQERLALERMLSRLHDQARELSKMHMSTSDLESKLSELAGRLERTVRGHRMAKLLYKNYESVKLMCERHPAHSQALIDELEAKLTQDASFITEVQQKLRKNIFESHDFIANNKILQRAAQDMTVLQNDMLVQRIRQRDHLRRMALGTFHSQPVVARAPLETGQSTEKHQNKKTILDEERSNGTRLPDSPRVMTDRWESCSELIRKRTFLYDVKDFFYKFYSSQSLQEQMHALHATTELRQRELKRMLALSETELEQARYDSQSTVGSNSREARELQTRLVAQLARHKHARETAHAVEHLRQASFGGLKHVCTLLGIPTPDQDTPINEIIHQMESVLEALMEEKDKTTQKLGASRQPTSGYDKIMRAPELDAALEHFEMSKSFIAHRLPAKVPDYSRSLHLGRTQDAIEAETDDNEGNDPLLVSPEVIIGARARDFLKREAHKSVRAEQRRMARMNPHVAL